MISERDRESQIKTNTLRTSGVFVTCSFPKGENVVHDALIYGLKLPDLKIIFLKKIFPFLDKGR